MPRSWLARCELRDIARSIENTASSAVKGVPSWKLTFGRSRKRQTSGAARSQDTASEGSSLKARSRLTSPS